MCIAIGRVPARRAPRLGSRIEKGSGKKTKMAASSSDRGEMATDYPCFHLFDVVELLQFNEGSDSKNKKKQIRCGISIFQDFYKEIKAEFDGDLVDNEALDLLLSQFYVEPRNQNGKYYSKKTMQALRFSLQRHFLASRNLDITKEDSFSRSGKTFKAVVKNLKATGEVDRNNHLIWVISLIKLTFVVIPQYRWYTQRSRTVGVI